MSDLTSEQFAQLVRQLGLTDSARLDAIERQCDVSRISGPDFLHGLVQRGLLTQYQCDKLLRGDRDGFFYGKYMVLSHISHGTFARVYDTVQVETGEHFALKVLRKEQADVREIRERFRREGELCQTLKHEHIVAVYDLHARGSRPYLVMELIKGPSLRSYVQSRQKLQPLEAARIMRQITSGLWYAFTRGLAHRDLKLTNVLITTEGKAKLIDFGLAGADSDLGSDQIQVSDAKTRTVDYAALEDASHAPRNDMRSDTFFAGCMLYHMLTGQPPLTETTDREERMKKSRFTELVPIEQVDKSIPGVLTQIVHKAMQLSPTQRYQTPGEMMMDLQRAEKGLAGGGGTSRNRGRSVIDQRAAVGSSVDAKRATVMIVESESKLQEVFREHLKVHGYRVLVLSDARRAMDRLADDARNDSTMCHAVVLNADSLGRASLEVFNNLGRNQDLVQLSAILLLGEQQTEWLAQCSQSERRRVLQMPFKMSELIGLLGKITDQGTASALAE